jgi:Ca-activated chloride channel homolog
MQDQPRHKFRRAVIVIGDGDDNAEPRLPRPGPRDGAQSRCRDLLHFTNITRVQSDGDRTLKYFADETGGQVFFPFKVEDLSQDFENIANELRSQYSILYRPEPLITDGQYHPGHRE